MSLEDPANSDSQDANQEPHHQENTESNVANLDQSTLTAGLGCYLYSALGFIILVLVYWIISYYFSSSLESIGFPAWGDFHPVIRGSVLFLFVIAALILIIWFVNRVVKLGKTPRTTLSIFVVVMVVVPGSIVLSTQPPGTQIVIAQIALILVFTALPASLYPMFLTGKGRTLWEEFMQNLSYLDPVGYRQQESIYRKKFVALYGESTDSSLSSRIFTGENSFPVVLTTFIIGLGWLLFFLTIDGAPSFKSGVVSPFTFGFLGAYLYSLQMLFRRYVQSDLKTTAYTHAAQRILITWVWAFVLSVLPWEFFRLSPDYENEVVSVLTFVVGIFPDIAWQVISLLFKPLLGIAIKGFKQEHPLNEINGITVWVEARLLEENIENIQNLVTSDIPDLMLRTNLHPSRIVDWIDQGILKLHLPSKKDGEEELKQILLERGIVSATDLLYSYQAFQKRIKGNNINFLEKIPNRIIEGIIDTFEDDPNMYHIRSWRDIYAKQSKLSRGAIDDLLNQSYPSSDIQDDNVVFPQMNSD